MGSTSPNPQPSALHRIPFFTRDLAAIGFGRTKSPAPRNLLIPLEQQPLEQPDQCCKALVGAVAARLELRYGHTGDPVGPDGVNQPQHGRGGRPEWLRVRDCREKRGVEYVAIDVDPDSLGAPGCGSEP